jgi:hypothetical protein
LKRVTIKAKFEFQNSWTWREIEETRIE